MEAARRRMMIVAASLMVSFSAIFVRWSDAPSAVLAFYRMLFASLVIVPIALIRYRKDLLAMGREDLVLSAISGILFALHFLAYFESLGLVSIASSTVLADTAVFFVAAIMVLVFKEKIARRNWIVMMITFGGCALIACGDSAVEFGILGDALALASSAMFSVYAIIGRKGRRNVSTVAYTSVVYVSAALTALVCVCTEDTSALDCGYRNILCGLGLAVFCTLLGHTVYNWGLRYESPAFVAITTLLEPVFGSVLGLFIFAEVPGTLVILGSAVVLAGVYLFSAADSYRHHAHGNKV